MTWRDQLNEITVDHLFGSTVKWKILSVDQYLEGLEKVGALDLFISDLDTLKFVLPPDKSTQSDIFLFILTNGKMPTKVTVEDDVVQLDWDY